MYDFFFSFRPCVCLCSLRQHSFDLHSIDKVFITQDNLTNIFPATGDEYETQEYTTKNRAKQQIKTLITILNQCIYLYWITSTSSCQFGCCYLLYLIACYLTLWKKLKKRYHIVTPCFMKNLLSSMATAMTTAALFLDNNIAF